MNSLTNHGNPIPLSSGKPAPLLTLTPRAKRLHEIASEAAKARGDNYVGCDHILIALIRMNLGVAGWKLESAGITEESITSLLD